jgi:iron complex outermembrane receptor protein
MTGNAKRKWVIMSLLSGTAMTLGLSDAALAQAEGQESTKDGATQERNIIVVTATRREESIVDVPYNISAVSGDTIESAKTFDSAELLRSVPGVGVVDRGARNAGTINQVRIRGLNVDGNGLGD